MTAIGCDILDIGSSKWNKYNGSNNLSFEQEIVSHFTLPAVDNVILL